jgi:hypothetical protein
MFKRIFNSNQSGAALLNVTLAAAAVGAGLLLVSKTGIQRNKATLSENQNIVIENTIMDMRTILADSDSCKTAMELAQPFSEIGPYVVGNEIDFDVEITAIELAPQSNAADRNQVYIARFDKVNESTGARSEKTELFEIQKFKVENSAGVDVDSCSSKETDGVNEAVKLFCESLGAQFNIITGKCDLSSIDISGKEEFIKSLGKISCESLGGTFVDGSPSRCSDINLPLANLETSHLKSSRVDVSSTRRTDFPDTACTGTQISNGVNEDGSLKCTNVVCPKLLSDSFASRFEPALAGSSIECQCKKDRGTELACGARDRDSCVDYDVDDGCGFGQKCTIRKGKFPDRSCARTTFEDEFCRDPNCGRLIRGTKKRPVVVTPPVVTPPVKVTPPVTPPVKVSPPVVTPPPKRVCTEGSLLQVEPSTCRPDNTCNGSMPYTCLVTESKRCIGGKYVSVSCKAFCAVNGASCGAR